MLQLNVYKTRNIPLVHIRDSFSISIFIQKMFKLVQNLCINKIKEIKDSQRSAPKTQNADFLNSSNQK